MYPFKRILFATDFSPASEAIVPYVNDMVQQNSASLVIVHAFDPVSAMFSDPSTMVEAFPVFRKSVEDQLAKFVKDKFPDQKFEVVMEEGEPSAVILKTIERYGADLLMMSTHGQGMFRRMLLGSVTSKILHDVNCAVWTGIHEKPRGHAPQLPYQSVLCAVSTDDEAQAIWKAADSFAKMYGSKLTIAHTIETPTVTWDVDFSPMRQEMLTYASDRLELMKNQLGVGGEVKLYEGSVSVALHEAVTASKADLVITGRGHVQDRFSRFTSHLYAIVRDSPCPVLSI